MPRRKTGWRGPDYEGEFPSLGWELLDLFEAFLVAPSGPLAGEPLKFTDEQVATFVHWYRIDPVTGRYLYRRGSKRAPKGKGKSPEAAAMAFGEFVGPVVFDGWDADGEPVGRPQGAPVVQVAACSEDQTGNTFGALYDMLRESPAIAEYKIDVGRMQFRLHGRPGRLEPVTSSAGSREGEPVTFAVLDETHLWTSRNGGRRLAATLRRNAAKMGGRTWETTNAFVPGEESVAEATHQAWTKGQAGLYGEAVEAPWVEDLTDRAKLRAALEVAYGDAKAWVPLDRIVEDIQDPSTDPSDARRFYLNQLVKGESQAVDPVLWADLEVDDDLPERGAYVGLGFDGSISDDATALIGCTPDGWLFEVAVWERPAGQLDWTVPRLEVESAIVAAFERWKVGRMLCDPPRWHTEIDSWAERWNVGKAEDAVVFKFDTNTPRRMAPACDRFTTAVAGRSLRWSGETLGRHVLAMARKKVRITDPEDDGRTRFILTKADTRKIDAGVGAVLALEAAQTMPVEPVSAAAAFLEGSTWKCPNGHRTLRQLDVCRRCGAERPEED